MSGFYGATPREGSQELDIVTFIMIQALKYVNFQNLYSYYSSHIGIFFIKPFNKLYNPN